MDPAGGDLISPGSILEESSTGGTSTGGSRVYASKLVKKKRAPAWVFLTFGNWKVVDVAIPNRL